MSKIIPREALCANDLIKKLIGKQVIGIYLYGSAVEGGLQNESDVDILVITNQSLLEKTRKAMTEQLLSISGKIGNKEGLRYLEVTVVNKEDLSPWSFPPKHDYMYGEWLRDQFEKGEIPEPANDPDLVLLLAQAREKSITLFGKNIAGVLDPVPAKDIQKAVKASLPELTSDIKGDDRNVILTLARMWFTADTGEITSKDQSAKWVIQKLSEEHAALVELARSAYLGERIDDWEDMESEVHSLVNYMEKGIYSLITD